MKVSAKLTFRPKFSEAMFKALEDEKGKSRRTEVDIKLKGEEVVIDITAEDATAMRAALNNYLRIAQTIEELEG